MEKKNKYTIEADNIIALSYILDEYKDAFKFSMPEFL